MLKFLLLPLVIVSLAWSQNPDRPEDDDELEVVIERAGKELQDPLAHLPGQDPAQAGQPPADSLLGNSMISNMMGDAMKSALMEYIKENPFSKMGRLEVGEFLMNSVKGKPAERMFKDYPKIFNLLVDLLHDPKAIPSFLGIINKGKLMKTYGVVVIIIMLIFFALNLLNSKGSLLKRIGMKLVLMLGSAVANFGAFYYLFRAELQPSVDVIARSLFG